ncbi:MAG: S41 family peptidase [Pseudomonadota bacterium]
MTRTLSLALTVLTLLAPLAAAALSPQQVEADIALAREAFERVHPGYDRYADPAALGDAWQAIVSDAQTAGEMPLADLYLRVQAVLAMIRCDHTKAELPADMAKARRSDPVYLPLRFTLVENRAIVVAVPENSEVRLHDEILAIDGQSIASLVERFAPLVPVDGFTDHARAGELAYSREFSGGAIEHFMALEGVGPKARLQLADADGNLRDVDVARVGLDAQSAISATLDGAANFADAVTLEMAGDDTAILSVDTFVNYREPVDPDDVYGPIFDRLASSNVRHLVVDLRENGGGSDDARDRLFAHLITKSARVVSEVHVRTLDLDGLRDHLSTWESRALNPSRWWFSKEADNDYRLRGWLFGVGRKIKPPPNAFEGKLTVLTSAANSSGSTMLIGALKNQGRGRFIGEPTGGNIAGSTAGILFFLKLPESGLVLRLPAQRMMTEYSGEDAGTGVIPDVEVTATVADLRAGRDPVLKAALVKR